jgi:hypothetical protein
VRDGPREGRSGDGEETEARLEKLPIGIDHLSPANLQVGKGAGLFPTCIRFNAPPLKFRKLRPSMYQSM